MYTGEQHTRTQESSTHVHRRAAHMYTGEQHTCTQESSTHVHRRAAHMYTGEQHTCTQKSSTHVHNMADMTDKALQTMYVRTQTHMYELRW